jgi:hypothetical protein
MESEGLWGSTPSFRTNLFEEERLSRANPSAKVRINIVIRGTLSNDLPNGWVAISFSVLTAPIIAASRAICLIDFSNMLLARSEVDALGIVPVFQVSDFQFHFLPGAPYAVFACGEVSAPCN